MSGLTGFIGMSLAVRGNVRTAAGRTASLPTALRVAFPSGRVAGMFTVGLGLLGASVIITVFQNTSSAILVGFGLVEAGRCAIAASAAAGSVLGPALELT